MSAIEVIEAGNKLSAQFLPNFEQQAKINYSGPRRSPRKELNKYD
jgi:hypothetical protein